MASGLSVLMLMTPQDGFESPSGEGPRGGEDISDEDLAMAVAGARQRWMALGISHEQSAEANLAPEACATIGDHRCLRPLDFLRIMPQQRGFALQHAWAASLSYPAAPELTRGLTLHFGAQKLSAPGESRAQQIELDAEALRAFFAAGLEAGLEEELAFDGGLAASTADHR